MEGNRWRRGLTKYGTVGDTTENIDWGRRSIPIGTLKALLEKNCHEKSSQMVLYVAFINYKKMDHSVDYAEEYGSHPPVQDPHEED